MIRFKVTPDNGEPYEIEATSRDIYTWEKTNHGKTYKTSVAAGSIVDFTEMAYYAARRQGRFTGKLTEFAATNDIEGVTGEDEDASGPDPTQPAP